MTKGEIQNVISEMGITVTSTFVPFSRSRNKSEKNPSLNWDVHLYNGANHVLTTQYSAGIAHCPAYKDKSNFIGAVGYRLNVIGADTIKRECETGVRWRNSWRTTEKIEPDSLDVLYALSNDADVLNSSGFEEWAGNFGYDADSRKAEKTYCQCLKIALQLRNGIGEDNLKRLQELFLDY